VLAGQPGEPVVLLVDPAGQEVEVDLVTAVVVGDLQPGSALVEAGLEPRDRLVAVDGREVTAAGDVAAAIASGEAVSVTVERVTVGEDGELATERHEATVPAEAARELSEELIGLAGFVPGSEGVGPLTAAQMTFVGEGSFPAMVVATFEAFGQIFGPEGIGAIPEQLAGGERDPTGASLASPVGLAQIAGEGTTRAGLFFLLGLLAALNVFIGIFNLLPLPPLDGGHLAVLGVERSVNAVRSARGLAPDYRVDPRTITAIAIPVIFLLGALFLAVLALDIVNPLRLPQ
jgi:regulator of sigma E protease